MRYAIIDNSTLTAVQRLLGEIEVENAFCLDGDIAAFESLIQSILFYDTIFFVDDYKAEHRSARHKTFHYLLPLSTDVFPYGAISTAAAKSVEDLTFRVKGGTVSHNEIGDFLDRLKMYTMFTWDMRSSNWFLTMKMLEKSGSIDTRKYSALSEMIFLELSANPNSTSIKPNPNNYSLISSRGETIPDKSVSGSETHEITDQINAFAASMSWLAMRTSFYTLLSNAYEADAILHPIRSSFQLSLANRMGQAKGAFAPILQRFADETARVVKDITSTSDPVIAEMEIPLFSAWLITKTESPKAAIAAAFEMRMYKPVMEARQHLIELEEFLKNPVKTNFVREVNKLVREVESAGDVLRKLYDVGTKNGVVLSPLISIFNSVGQFKGLPTLPAVPIKVSLPDRLLEIGIRKGFKGVLRSVTQDLTAVGRLGQQYEKLTSAVRYKNGEMNTYLPKTEDIRFLGKSAWWKKPM